MLSVAQKSIIGTRNDQQDAFYSAFLDDTFVAVVCDGMGGSNGGGAAANLAVDKMKELFHTKNKEENFSDFLLRSIDLLDETVATYQKSNNCPKAGTTVAAIAIEGNSLWWLSVGDSSIYIMRDNEIMPAVREHNAKLAQTLYPNDDNYKKISRLDTLISFIGMRGVKIYDINNRGFELLSGDKILLTTDGLTKLLSPSEILEISLGRNPNEALGLIFSQATKRANGSQDNTTSILVEYQK